MNNYHVFLRIAPPIFLAAFGSNLFASIPTKHGTLFDGCPLCQSGRIGPDGMPLDPFYNNPDFSVSVEMSPDGIARRPQRMSAATRPAPADPANNSAIASGAAAASSTAANGFSTMSGASAEPPPEITKGADGFWRVSFANLASFKFTSPPETEKPRPGSKQDIPAQIVELEGRKICVSGYMIPIKLENGLAKEFLLVRSPMLCCYGIVPAPNEWVVVNMKGKGAVPVMDVSLNFYGTLHVGQVVEENMFAGIYAMDGEKVSVN